MASNNPVLTALTPYVEEHNDELIAKSVLSSKSAQLFNLQTGVKGASALNLIDTDVVLQNGEACGWTESGTTELSQRVLNPVILKVNHAFCPTKLAKYWTAYKVRLSQKGLEAEGLPFEQYFTEGITDGVSEQIEKMIWQGTSGQTDEFEGIISILNTASASTVNVSAASGTSAYAFIKQVYMAMPEAIREKDDAAIFVSAGVFREFIQDIIAANMYHYDANDGSLVYVLPGTNCKIYGVNGLNDTVSYDYAIAGRQSNFFYGIDMEGDAEEFDLWFDKSSREWRLAILFNAGVQVAYPDEIVNGKRAK